MRELYIKNTQCFILLYSVTSQHSFNDALDLREMILRVKDLEDPSLVPIILCGVNVEHTDDRMVGKAQGEARAAAWKCPFFEVSTKNRTEVAEVFATAVRFIIQTGPEKTTKPVNKGIFRRWKNIFSGSA